MSKLASKTKIVLIAAYVISSLFLLRIILDIVPSEQKYVAWMVMDFYGIVNTVWGYFVCRESRWDK